MHFILSICTILIFGTVSAQKIVTGEWTNITRQIQEKEIIPKAKSNNNLDIVAFNNKYYLGFRTAPTHFPSANAVMYILSSTDMKEWTLEQRIYFQQDLREPRFTVHNDSLYFYFFTGSDNWHSFIPKELLVMSTDGSGKWTDAASTGLDGFVPWRIRKRNDTLYLSAYYGVNLYSKGHHGNLRLFSSTNGRQWTAITKMAQVSESTAEEGEFIFDKKGDLYATVRLESTGSLIAKASADSIGKWVYKRSAFKYDSALMFEHNDDIYMIARRNVPGEVDRSKAWLGDNLRRMLNLAKYSLSSKKTALYKIDKENLEVIHLMDFPSTGDNAFPGIVKISDNEYVVFNYSSDIDGPEKIWIEGQVGKTFLYYSTLTFQEQ